MNIRHLLAILDTKFGSAGALLLTTLMAFASLWFIVYIVASNWLDYRASILPHRYRKPLAPKSLRRLRRYDNEGGQT